MAQTISYEVRLALLLISFISVVTRVNLVSLGNLSRAPLLMLILPLIFIWLLSALAETNRTPFDFAEGERELVRGFNVEYGAGGFALIFMAEYGIILLLRGVRALLLGARVPITNLTVIITTIVAYWWVWVRATLPRFRYDKLIGLA